MELAEIYYALHRTDDTISVLKRIVELDGKYDFVEAQNALNDIEIALKEEAAQQQQKQMGVKWKVEICLLK